MKYRQMQISGPVYFADTDIADNPNIGTIYRLTDISVDPY